MKIKSSVLLLFIVLIGISCSTSIVKYAQPYVSTNEVNRSILEGCFNPINYIPDTIHKEIEYTKIVRINWHSVDDTTGLNNFKGEEMMFFRYLTDNANYRLSVNFKMDLPIGNKTPVYDPMLRWQITPSKGYEKENGLYHHLQEDIIYFVNKGSERSDYDESVIDKYKIGGDTICNVFVVAFPPDYKERISMNQSGIALGNHIKLGGLKQANKPDWEFATLLNHEIGHVFGLSHAWHEDGCDDTPTNPNCWSKTDSPPCDKNVSNNLMDYNSSQMAISPCQIGRMHMNIADTLNRQRKLVIPEWCKMDPQPFIIRDSISWLGFRDIKKSIIIEKGGVLKVCCRLGMPKGSSITVKIGGTLILEDVTLHNDCNEEWYGIYTEKRGRKKGNVIKKGMVNIKNVGEVKL